MRHVMRFLPSVIFVFLVAVRPMFYFILLCVCVGGGAALPDALFLFFFPYSADQEWDWPSC